MFFCCEVLGGQGGLSGQLSLYLSHQVNKGLSLSINPLVIGGPSAALYLSLLVQYQGMLTVQGDGDTRNYLYKVG